MGGYCRVVDPGGRVHRLAGVAEHTETTTEAFTWTESLEVCYMVTILEIMDIKADLKNSYKYCAICIDWINAGCSKGCNCLV